MRSPPSPTRNINAQSDCALRIEGVGVGVEQDVTRATLKAEVEEEVVV